LKIGPTSAANLQWDLEAIEDRVPLPSIRRTIGELRGAGYNIRVIWSAGWPEYVLGR
jgi:hypothetical protein